MIPQIFYDFEEAATGLHRPAVVLGTFDGVHRGHQALIGKTVSWARAHQTSCAIITFDPIPASVLFPGGITAPLTRLKRRLELFGELGAEAAIVLNFSREMARISAGDFAQKSLFSLNPSAVFVGENFTFGQGREGNPQLLRPLCQNRSVFFSAEKITTLAGTAVSSTEIRRRLLEGDLSGASAMLGRPFSLEGKVVHGRARGRKMGFPTANIQTDGLFLPKGGVYAPLAFVQECPKAMPAVLNLGKKPTFGETDTTLETFILDPIGDLYGRDMQLRLLKRLRDERKFSSASELAAQIELDCAEARALLAAAK